jgi:hypothetical protein
MEHKDPEVKVKVLEMPPLNPGWILAFLTVYTIVFMMTR